MTVPRWWSDAAPKPPPTKDFLCPNCGREIERPVHFQARTNKVRALALNKGLLLARSGDFWRLHSADHCSDNLTNLKEVRRYLELTPRPHIPLRLS